MLRGYLGFFGYAYGAKQLKLSMANSLSQRGLTASDSPSRVDIDLYFEAMDNVYDREENPDGAFPLNVAENKLSWHFLKEKIKRIHREIEIPDWIAGYTNPIGADEIREIIAAFLGKYLFECEISADYLALSAGATAVVELSAFLLGNEGDVVAIPAPAYPVYKQDMGNFPGLLRHDIVTHHDLTELALGPVLSVEHLEKARYEIQQSGRNFAMLLLTQPDNPTGLIYSKNQLEQIADWCIQHKVHLVVNEIYGLSLINSPGNSSNSLSFYSFAKIMQAYQSDFLHHWYAFSKDFGISGFRVGVVHSYNETFLSGYKNLSLPRMVSNHTQWLLGEILKDEAFIQQYIKENQGLLSESYAMITGYLDRLNIPYSPAQGSLFIWLDLSAFIEDKSQNGEEAFWQELYQQTGLLLTPSNGFGHSKLGQFRMVFTYFPKKEMQVAMERLFSFLQTRNS